MNIKFLIRDLQIEGVQIVIIRLARLLQKNGHDVEIITLYEKTKLTNLEDLSITSFNIPENIRDIKIIQPYFEQWYKSLKSFDLLLAPHSESIKLISNYSDSRLIPYIHNSDEPSFNKRGFFKKIRYIYRIRKRLKGKRILCVSQGINKFTKECCRSSIRSIHTLYNPFDIENTVKLSNYPIKENNFGDYVIFVGRLENQKRIDRLLKTFSLLKNKSINLLIMGEGHLLQELKSLANDLNVDNRVIFTRFEINPYPLMKQARCLVLTSDHEGFGNVLVESLIVGTPAISIDCPSGPDEILTGELSKYLIHSYDEKVIAERIDALLEDRDIPDLSAGYEKFTEEKVYQSFMTIVEQWNNDKH